MSLAWCQFESDLTKRTENGELGNPENATQQTKRFEYHQKKNKKCCGDNLQQPSMSSILSFRSNPQKTGQTWMVHFEDSPRTLRNVDQPWPVDPVTPWRLYLSKARFTVTLSPPGAACRNHAVTINNVLLVKVGLGRWLVYHLSSITYWDLLGFIGLVWNPSKFINQPMGIWDIYGHHSLKQIWAISPWTSLVYPLVVCSIASWKQQPLVRWFPTTLTFTDSFGISQPARFEDRGQSSIFHQYPIHRLHEIPHYPPWYSL